MVDSGYTLACLPDELDALDRAAVEAFWEGERCLQFVKERVQRVQMEREKITLSEAPEDQLLALWFEGETARRNRALQDEVEALLIEEGLLPDLKK